MQIKGISVGYKYSEKKNSVAVEYIYHQSRANKLTDMTLWQMGKWTET